MKTTLLEGSPVGPRLIIDLDYNRKEDSLIVLSDESARILSLNGRIGQVVAMGLDCYNGVFQDRVGATKPWCKVGDIVGIRSHASLFVEDAKAGFISVNDQDVIHNFSNSKLCVKGA